MEDTFFTQSVYWLRRETKRVISILQEFDETAWSRPSFCPGWTAAHIIGHLTGVAISHAERISASREGRIVLSMETDVMHKFQARQQAIIDEIVALPGKDRITRLKNASDQLKAAYKSMQSEDLYRPVWDSRGVILVRQLPALCLFDVVLREWDMRNRPDAPLISDALGLMLKSLVYHLCLNYEKTNQSNISGSLRFQVTDPIYSWGLFLNGRHVSPIPANMGEFDATILATASDMVLLSTGRADFKAKQATGRLRIDGSRSKSETILRRIFLPY